MNTNKLTIMAATAVLASLLSFGGGRAMASPSTLVVDDDHGQCPSAAYTTIQSAITAASPGDTIQVCAGTYVENITIDKPLTLQGSGQGSSLIVPAVSNPDCPGGGSLCGGTASNIILVQANNVTIYGFTLNGDNPALTSGIVVGGADLDARNGIITNHTTGLYQNLTVYDTTVQNIFLRGIYASSGGSFNFHDNTVRNVQASGASIAMFNYGGSGIM
ncbi:MAG: DUF1565 domain-containing protein, partial [Chloroflexota bacterium]|nr:DUF1565 domain-containing protein [Chloroflexota bacterium]